MKIENPYKSTDPIKESSRPYAYRQIERDEEGRQRPDSIVGKVSKNIRFFQEQVRSGKISPEDGGLGTEATRFLDFLELELGAPIEQIPLAEFMRMQKIFEKDDFLVNEKEEKHNGKRFKSDFDLIVLGAIAICLKEERKRRAY